MSSYKIHVFISHSWKYSHQYNTIANWIFEQNWSSGQASLSFHDYSVPKEFAFDTSGDFALRTAIFNQIARSHVVIIPTGMYVNYSKWIQKEIDGAKYHQKRILAVNPWGQERKSSVV